jgi:hypothetical protein
MPRVAVVIPMDNVNTVNLPDLSLVDGSADAGYVSVRSLDGPLFQRAVSVRIPLDPTSSRNARKTHRLIQFRRHVFHPVFLLMLLTWLAVSVVFFTVVNGSGSFHWWQFVPVTAASLAAEALDALASRSALPQYPRMEKTHVRIAEVPKTVADEIVRLNPGGVTLVE